MEDLLEPVSKTVGIILLAMAGWIAARKISGLRFWWLGLMLPLIWLGIVIIHRWFPETGTIPAVNRIMAGRRENAAAAFFLPLLLILISGHLQHRRQQRLLNMCTALFIVQFSVVSFLGPIFEISQSTQIGYIDKDGICIQRNGYNCGPAAAVTALRWLGIPAEEGELARAAHTTRFGGSAPDNLIDAIQNTYDIRCFLQHPDSLDSLSGQEPFIALVKLSLLVDHYVVVLQVEASRVLIGDPLSGLCEWTLDEFCSRWRGPAILFESL